MRLSAVDYGSVKHLTAEYLKRGAESGPRCRDHGQSEIEKERAAARDPSQVARGRNSRGNAKLKQEGQLGL